ncbi:unnamed protein product [Strongylus vulgaris]|uniref:Uncharacterized protein n=1 Tax=Strongylus vulgaris TaxID=40348 RepID=A0A3P7JUL3_STRVU|nr:unnamed protein product [Strongylus vulgaris]
MLDVLNSRFWNKSHEDDDVGTRVQTQIVALIKATVERCIILKKLKVPERRKGTRTEITEHLVAACICRTSRRDEEISVCAVRDLLLPNVGESSEAFTVKEPLPDIDDDLIDVAEIGERDLLALRSVRFLFISLIAEHLVAACICRTSRRDEEISVCAVRDLLLPIVGESSEAFTVKEPLPDIDDDLIDVAEIGERDLLALRSTADLERSRRYADTTPKTHFLDKPSSIPLILFDLKSLLIRLSAFVVDNQHLSGEDKKSMIFFVI